MQNLKNMNTSIAQKLSFNSRMIVWLTSIVYLALTVLLMGLKPEHWFIVGFYNLCFMLNARTRKFILALTVFVIFGIVYDFMKAYPNYLVNTVDISGLYHFEKSIFGFTVNGQIVTPNEFFAQHHNTFLDLLAGIFYVNWMPVPLAFAIWLYFRNKQQFLHFSLSFFFVNLIGFAIYYIHPAAPPWYVQQYGFNFHLNVPGSPGALARFDSLVHLPVFSSIYSRNSNVFAAMPSLHCAYPVVVLYYGIRNKVGWVNMLLGLFMIGIWFSAIYSGHHYLTDVIMGTACAITGLFIFQKYLLENESFKRFLEKYEKAIS